MLTARACFDPPLLSWPTEAALFPKGSLCHSFGCTGTMHQKQRMPHAQTKSLKRNTRATPNGDSSSERQQTRAVRLQRPSAPQTPRQLHTVKRLTPQARLTQT